MMSTDTKTTPYGIARIGRLEMVVKRAKAENADQMADVVAERVRTNAAGGDGGFHGEIAEAITALMDIHDPEPRRRMSEAMFDTITIEKPEAPQRGDTVHDGTLTGLKVEVEDAWIEARVDDRAVLWSRKLRLTPTGLHGERAPWAPRNYVFGFWGTWDRNDRARALRISPASAGWPVNC